jgi:hypothetical protein
MDRFLLSLLSAGILAAAVEAANPPVRPINPSRNIVQRPGLPSPATFRTGPKGVTSTTILVPEDNYLDPYHMTRRQAYQIRKWGEAMWNVPPYALYNPYVGWYNFGPVYPYPYPYPVLTPGVRTISPSLRPIR